MAVYVRSDPNFRRAYVQPAPRRWFARRLGLLAHLLALAAAAAGAAWSLQALKHADVLRIDTVTVEGARRLSPGEVAGLVAPLRGENLLAADLEAGREGLLASGWVRGAELRRVLPSAVHVRLDERAPVGLGRIGSRLYLVDETGHVMDEHGPRFADLDLPLIDGLSGGAPVSDADARRAALAARLLADVAAHGGLADRVSQVDVADPRDAVVLLNGDPARIHLGERDFAARLRTYLDVAPALREAVPDIDYVDVRFDRRVYVGPAAGPGAMARIGLAGRSGERRQRGT